MRNHLRPSPSWDSRTPHIALLRVLATLPPVPSFLTCPCAVRRGYDADVAAASSSITPFATSVSSSSIFRPSPSDRDLGLFFRDLPHFFDIFDRSIDESGSESFPGASTNQRTGPLPTLPPADRPLRTPFPVEEGRFEADESSAAIDRIWDRHGRGRSSRCNSLQRTCFDSTTWRPRS